MGGRESRRKGHNWERRVARDLTEWTTVTHQRVLTETRDGNSGDVLPKGSAPFVYQCKSAKRPNFCGAVKEAEAASHGYRYAVGAIEKTFGPGKPAERYAVLPWSDWLELSRVIYKASL